MTAQKIDSPPSGLPFQVARRWFLRLRNPLLVGLVVGVVLGGLNVTFTSPDRQYDLEAFLASGRAALAGQDPYAPAAWAPPRGASDVLPNMNPPIWLLLFAPAAVADFRLVAVVWYVFSLALYAVMLWLLARTTPASAPLVRLAWGICLGGLWHTLILGQIYLLMLLPTIGAWLWLRQGRVVPAGLAIGLVVALKPNFVLWPILLLLAGHLLPAVWAGVSASLLTVIPAIVFGPQVYGHWLTLVRTLPQLDVPVRNIALPAVVARLGAPEVGLALTGVLLAALALGVLWRRPDWRRVSELALVAAILAGPLSWIGYTLLLLPLFWERARWSPPLAVIAWLLTYPAISLVGALGVPAVPMGSLYALIVLALGGILVWEARRAAGRTAAG